MPHVRVPPVRPQPESPVMSPPVFENRISLTTLVAAANLALLLVGGGAAYATIRAELRIAHEADARLTLDIAALRNEAATRELRIRSLELGAGRTEEKLTSILAALTRIERQLEDR
jgi:hypothetical protein